MLIRKFNWPNIDRWGTPALILFQLEVFRFNTTPWYLSDKKLSISINKSQIMPLRLSLYISPSCHTLSNALEISRNTPRTSREGLQSKTLFFLVSDRYKLLDTRITRDKTWSMRWKKIFFYKIMKQAIENQTFKYLTTDWEQGNWSVTFS